MQKIKLKSLHFNKQELRDTYDLTTEILTYKGAISKYIFRRYKLYIIRVTAYLGVQRKSIFFRLNEDFDLTTFEL